MKHAFAVVGHANWGKSSTLKEFAGSAHQHWVEFKGIWFYVKHMSNDDISGELLEWIENFIEKNMDNDCGLIFALCPDFQNLEKKTKNILELLSRLNIKIKFFVLDRNYNTKKFIDVSEIKELKTFGRVYSIDGSSENSERAAKLKKFIIDNI